MEIFWNDNSGGFSDPTTISAAGGDPVEVLIVQVNDDDFYDLVIVNQSTDKITLALSPNAPLTDSNIQSCLKTFSTIGKPSAIRVGYMDSDLLRDLVVVQSYEGDTCPANENCGVAIHYQIPGPAPFGLNDPNDPNAPTRFASFSIEDTGSGPYPEPVDLELADFDRDGTRLDVVTANRATGDLRFLRNVGGDRTSLLETAGIVATDADDLVGVAVGSFNPYDHMYHRQLGAPVGVTKVWFNNLYPEGDTIDPLTGMTTAEMAKPDVAAISEGDDMLYVCLNKTTSSMPGTNFSFSSPHAFPVGDAPQDIVAVDLKNFRVRTRETVNLKFDCKVPPVADHPLGWVGDQPTDLVVTNRGSRSISVLLSRGGMDRMLFDPAIPFEVGVDPAGLAVAQLGWTRLSNQTTSTIDFLVCNETSKTLSILQDNGNAVPGGGQEGGTEEGLLSMRRPSEFTTANRLSPQLVAVGEFDGGAQMPTTVDFAAIAVSAELGQVQADLTLFHSDGNEIASGASIVVNDALPGGEVWACPALMDMVAGQFVGSTSPSTPRADDLPIEERTQLAIALYPENGQGQALRSISAFLHGVVLIYDTNPLLLKESLDVGHGACALAAGDFAQNGEHSIVVANALDHSVTLWINDGNSFTETEVLATGGLQPRDVALADLNRDGRLDLLVANMSTNSVTFLPGRDQTVPNDYFGSPVTILQYDTTDLSDSQGPLTLLVGDFDEDSPGGTLPPDLDVAVANFGSGDVTILRNISPLASSDTATPIFEAPVKREVGNAPRRLAFADFLGDGDKELLVVNQLPDNHFPLQQDRIGVPTRINGGTVGALSYSADDRYVAWISLRTPEEVNFDPPADEGSSFGRCYQPRVMILDRCRNAGPQRLNFTINTESVDFWAEDFRFRALDPGSDEDPNIHQFAVIGGLVDPSDCTKRPQRRVYLGKIEEACVPE